MRAAAWSDAVFRLQTVSLLAAGQKLHLWVEFSAPTERQWKNLHLQVEIFEKRSCAHREIAGVFIFRCTFCDIRVPVGGVLLRNRHLQIHESENCQSAHFLKFPFCKNVHRRVISTAAILASCPPCGQTGGAAQPGCRWIAYHGLAEQSCALI
jgi:hypothetical protein